ncbi:MAG: hypothetical protein JSU00_09275 [Acidobacteria bacterium]|nr:hypothetical protein [Acidobacteriota bacterium]
MPMEPPIPPVAADESARSRAVGIDAPESGVTTADDKMRFEVDLLVRRALGDACAEIRKRVDTARGAGPAQLIFLDAATLPCFDVAAAFEAQAANLERAFGDAARQAGGGDENASFTLPVAAGAAAAVSLVKLFQSDTAYLGRKVEIQPRTLALELAHAWEGAQGVTVVLPEFSLIPEPMPAAIQERLDAVMNARRAAFLAIHKLADSLRTLKAGEPDYAAASYALNSAKHQFESADSILRPLSGKMTTPDPKSGVTPLGLVIRAARFRELAARGDVATYYLYVEAAAGGSYRTVKNFFRALAWADGLDASGGVLASYGLFANDGRLLASGTASAGRGFTPVRKLWGGVQP